MKDKVGVSTLHSYSIDNSLQLRTEISFIFDIFPLIMYEKTLDREGRSLW